MISAAEMLSFRFGGPLSYSSAFELTESADAEDVFRLRLLGSYRCRDRRLFRGGVMLRLLLRVSLRSLRALERGCAAVTS